MSGSLHFLPKITISAKLLLLLSLLPVTLPCYGESSKSKSNDQFPAFTVSSASNRANSKTGSTQYRRQLTVVQTQDWPFRWEPDPSKPITRVEIRLAEQRIYFMQGDVVVGEGPVSTGRPGFATPPGSYKVLVKEQLHYSNLYGEFVDSNGRTVNASAEAGDPVPKGLTYRPSPMPWFLRISDTGMGLHQGWLPGYAASHGCIRLPRKLAPLIFPAIPVGCPVIITPDEDAPTKVAKNNN